MSLSEQSLQWYPTSVQVTVLQARRLRIKGKNGTNDAYAIMQVAKDKFSTSVAEKSVAPVWKEEATFELSLFHNGNTENCTLLVSVMHRALMGPDKLLGRADINLWELSDLKSRNKTEWYKLLDKTGKPDKDRGEVLVDIQFMKNNMTASMFDLSATDKRRSRLGKFKDKMRGKNKGALSDSASAVVPSFTQVLTESEEEGEGEGEEGAEKDKKKKKKNKLKSLFAPKSNLQRQGLSQSMSVLGPLPEKNTPLTDSHSSGLNVDPSEGKKKFKFLTHKRTGSSDSKASQGSLSLVHSTIPALAEPTNLCVNGSHVYAEEPQARSSGTSSTFSLASSGHDSREDLCDADSRADEEYEEETVWMDEEQRRKRALERNTLEEERWRKEEQEKKRARQEEERLRFEEEDRMGESMRKEEQEKRKKVEEVRLEEERKIMEDNERMRRLEEEEERLRREEHERMNEEKRIREEEERVRKTKEEERLRKNEEEERLRKNEEEERLRKVEEEERVRKKEEKERLRKNEEEGVRKAKEEERLRKEMEVKTTKEEEQIKREEADRLRNVEEEKKIRDEERLRKEEVRRMEDEQTLTRKEEEKRLEERKKEEAKRRLDEHEEKMRDEEQREALMEVKERIRVEENQKKEELRRQDERTREEKKSNAQIKGEAPLEEVEKPMEQNRETGATLSNNPFEEVSPSPFHDTISNNPFEETPTTPPTGAISCRTNKVSAVKPRGGGVSRGTQDLSTDLMKKKDAPMPTNPQRWARQDNWDSEANCHSAFPNQPKMKPTKPPPPPRRRLSGHLVGSEDDQESVIGQDHSGVVQDKGPAAPPPDNQRWTHKSNWPSNSKSHSVTPTLAQPKMAEPPPPRANSPTSLVGSRDDQHLTKSVGKKDFSIRRDRHPAPLPPDRLNQIPSQTKSNQSMTTASVGYKERVEASVSKVSQCVVPMVTPLRSSSKEHISGGRSFTPGRYQAEEPIPSATGGLMMAQHNKGPAPSRPQYTPGKTIPEANVEKQTDIEECDSSVEFGANNPFAECCRMDRGEEQAGESQAPVSYRGCLSTSADPGPLQPHVVGDTVEVPTPEDVSSPTKSTSAKRFRAPLPPVKEAFTSRLDRTEEKSCVKPQSTRASTSGELSSGMVKTQYRGVGVAHPCVVVAPAPSAPSPAPSPVISSPAHSGSQKASEGRTVGPPHATSSGPETLLHLGDIPFIPGQCCGQEARGMGGRIASSTPRPHPVKPLNSMESQPTSNIPEGEAGKCTGILGGLQEKIKFKDTGVKGPYSQLTQEELISLVGKQQEQLSNRDHKIKELEQYIDNLLVRIIEEHPSLLMS